MRTIELEVNGVVATATLQSGAPQSANKLWNALPLEIPLTHAIRSGNCAEATADALVDADQKVEGQVSFFYPGMVAYRPSTGELTFAYGQGQARSATGTHWVTYLAHIDAGEDAIYKAWEQTRSVGATTITIRRKDDA